MAGGSKADFSEEDMLGVSLAQRGGGERARGHSSGENGQYKGWAVGVSGLLEEAPDWSAKTRHEFHETPPCVGESGGIRGGGPSDHLFQWFGDDHTAGPRAGYRQRPGVPLHKDGGGAVMASESIRENDDVEKESIPELISRLVLHVDGDSAVGDGR